MKTSSFLCNLVLFLVVSTNVMGSGLVVGEPVSETGAREIQLLVLKEGGYGDMITWKTEDSYPGTDACEVSSGGSVFWKQYRQKKSDDGTDHLFFEQRFIPSSGSLRLDGENPADGFKVSGGYLAYHYGDGPEPFLVSGALYDDVKTVRSIEISSAKDAVAAAVDAVLRSGELDVAVKRYDDQTVVDELESGAELWLHPTKDEGAFGFAWHVRVASADGALTPVVIDAQSSELLGIDRSPTWDNNCGPTSSSPSLSATGTPQRTYIGPVSLSGTPSSAPAWLCLDAHVPATATRPDIQILRGIDESTCHQDTSHKYDPAYAVCPDGVVGQAEYDNTEYLVSHPVNGSMYFCSPGRAITDALRHSMTTLDVFWNTLGHQGIQGSGVPFRVVVDARCPVGVTGAGFELQDKEYAPAGSVRVCGLSADLPWNSTPSGCAAYDNLTMQSVALDIMAHEMGHGVIFATTGWGYLSDREKQLHEGFADLIGHGVEHMQPNPPHEAADWTGGEDTGFIARRVDQDDGNLRFFYSDTQHDGSPHAKGTPLPVAMRLLSVGGVNPACTGGYNQPNAGACGNDVGSLGVEAAFKIYFKMLDDYMQPSSDWSSMPGFIVSAAAAVDPSAQGPSFGTNPGYQWCIPYSDYKYRAHQSMGAIELPGNVIFCSYPS